MKRIFSIISVLCIFLPLTASSANADDWPPPQPFYILSADGVLVFHVTPNFDARQRQIDDWADLPPTGLYYNTDPPAPIYLVDNPCWALWEQDFLFSRDMHYFVWIPQTNALGNRSDATALVFYAGGAVQKTYMVSDLVRDLDTVHFSTTTARWTNRNFRLISNFRLINNRLIIRTVDRETLVFDITTGEMIGTVTDFAAFFVVGMIALGGGSVFLIIKRRRTLASGEVKS